MSSGDFSPQPKWTQIRHDNGIFIGFKQMVYRISENLFLKKVKLKKKDCKKKRRL